MGGGAVVVRCESMGAGRRGGESVVVLFEGGRHTYANKLKCISNN